MGHITKVTVVQLLAFAGLVVFGLIARSLWHDEQERRFKEYERAQQEGRERSAALGAAKLAYRAANATNYVTVTNRPLTAQERELTERARGLLWGTNTTNRGKALWGTNLTNVSKP
jgi:hypothetical protein